MTEEINPAAVLEAQLEQTEPTIRAQLSEMISQFEDFQKEFQAKAREEIKKLFQKFWEMNPGVNAIIWTQYAPHFNDGDPCEFSVYDPTFTNAMGEDLDDVRYDDYEGEKEDIWADSLWGMKYQESDPEGVNKESLEAISSMICSTSLEDVMKAMFGSDSRVVATRAGFDVEEYSGSHD
jgi:hypothetical protein